MVEFEIMNLYEKKDTQKPKFQNSPVKRRSLPTTEPGYNKEKNKSN